MPFYPLEVQKMQELKVIAPQTNIFLRPQQPIAAQRDVRDLSCIFLKSSPIAVSLLDRDHFKLKNLTRVCLILTPSIGWEMQDTLYSGNSCPANAEDKLAKYSLNFGYETVRNTEFFLL